MDMISFFEIIRANPACYFVAGLILGYFLHSLVSSGFLSENRNKPPSRYQNKKVDSVVKRSAISADSEPLFDLTDASLNAITPRRRDA